jgi:vacuolar protein sorting-associated protein 13A/C
MFEALIEKVILSRLSGYIQDLDRNQLKVNLWSGKIVLENVKLNPKILLMLKVPLIFKHTKICKIDITIPWTSLSTSSVEITIQGIYCIMVPFPKAEWTFDIGMLVEKIKESLKNHELWWTIEKERKKLSEDANKQKSTYLEGLKENIVANLKVNLKDFHIRFEGICRKSEFSVGMIIDSIACLPQGKVGII